VISKTKPKSSIVKAIYNEHNTKAKVTIKCSIPEKSSFSFVSLDFKFSPPPITEFGFKRFKITYITLFHCYFHV